MLINEEVTIVPKIHFTYKKEIDRNNLCQGDLLEITDELKDVLREVHPYFLNDQYKYFMVLTQSCDLVRRSAGMCKTPYITLAAVKSFDSFIENKFINDKYAEKIGGYLLMDAKQKDRAYQLIERIYNNTEPDCFFLYKDDAVSLSHSMIVTLKVSIAIKSSLHYEKCLSAKILELSDEFKAKLGWLVGNIYSRVGTTDWDSIMTDSERQEMLFDELKNHCIIGTKQQIKKLKKELNTGVENLKNSEDLKNFILNCKIETKYDQVINVIEDIINTSSKKIPKEEKSKLINTIKSRSKLKVLINN